MPTSKRKTLRLLCFLGSILAVSLHSYGKSELDEKEEFQSFVRPFLAEHCDSCHSGEGAEAKFDTEYYSEAESVGSRLLGWEGLVDRAVRGEMPPADASSKPTPEELKRLQDWTTRFRRTEAERFAGDPGPMSMRRLSNAEFNYSVRDLTGVAIQPSKSFPIDPANEAGFDNSAESLTISPALVSKYLDGARLVADHMLLLPDRIGFAPFPVVTETDRDKHCVQKIVDFYLRQPTKLEYYLAALATHDSLKADGVRCSIEELAEKESLSPKYLALLQKQLVDSPAKHGPLRTINLKLKEIALKNLNASALHQECIELSEWVQKRREALAPKFENLDGKSMGGGSQSLVMWKIRKVAEHRRMCNTQALMNDNDGELFEDFDRSRYANGNDKDKQEILAEYQSFCSVIPDAFVIVERGRAFIDAKEADQEGKGRLLSAGFHSMTGYFRDDQPLYELILSELQQRELNRLWDDFELVSQAILRQYSSYIWFERAESGFINEPQFHFIRSEDRSSTSSETIERFRELYLEKVRKKNPNDEVIAAVQTHFTDLKRRLRELEVKIKEAEPKQLQGLLKFANQAFRRPLSSQEEKQIRDFYLAARNHPNADHRSAMEDTLVSILVSPSHLFRWDLQSHENGRHPLSDIELASRMSFFLWASLPDEELQRSPSEKQLPRMIQDERIRGMALEFLGNWLDFRRFSNHSAVDRSEFPIFDDELRQAMADEPIEYFLDLLRRNGKLGELLDSDTMILNADLAKYYGVEIPTDAKPNQWFRVEGARKIDRGGLIPMGVFLTQNAPGLRTSPVKRGYWVVKRLLGERIPAPPPNVPELPSSEHQLGELSLRDLLAKHREHASCAGCHQRFDSIGLLLEGFDPVGRPRTKDLGGRLVSTEANLPNGDQATGVVGLKDYVLKHRAHDFRLHFCRSLLAYALGRTLIVSDDLLVEEMMKKLAENDDRIQTPFEVILQSPQFRNKRMNSIATPELP